MQEKHSLEMRALKEHFSGFRAAQDKTVASLEAQLVEMRSHGGASVAPSGSASVGGNSNGGEELEAANDKLRRLEYQFRSKCSELDAAVQALSRSHGGSVATATVAAADTSGSSEDASAPAPVPPAPASVSAEVTFSMQEEIVAARLATAENEVAALQDQLTIEKRLNGDLRAEVQRMREEEARQDALATAGSPGADADPRVRGMSRRLNEMRRTAKAEVSRLKSQLAAATTQVEDLKSMKQEYATMKARYDTIQAQMASMRDDNVRKAKLLTSMKAAKATDSNAVEQWRNEVAELEEKVKRMQRSIASKDAMIRELKGRIEEDVAEAAAAGEMHTATMTANELRQRLRVSDLERARARSRVGAMRDKISELEAEVSLLREEAERLRRSSDRAEAMRAAINRKDALYKSQKSTLDKIKGELETVRSDAEARVADGERRVRGLQRQLAETEEQRLEAERECELMRRRATGSAVRLGDYPAEGASTHTGGYAHSQKGHRQQQNEDVRIIGRGSASSARRTQASVSTASVPVSAPEPPRQEYKVPSGMGDALGLDSSDLNDVISAIGENSIRAASLKPAGEVEEMSSGSMLGPVVNSSGSISASSDSVERARSTSTSSELSLERRLKSLARAALDSPAPKR